jgi:hypothetical protein
MLQRTGNFLQVNLEKNRPIAQNPYPSPEVWRLAPDSFKTGAEFLPGNTAVNHNQRVVLDVQPRIANRAIKKARLAHL